MKLTQRVFFVIAAATLVAAFSCAKAPQAAAPDPSVVVAHSAGIVSRGGDISVVLANGRDASRLADAQPFSFSPAVKGRTSWSEDGSRASFKPEEPLKAGQSYRVRFDFAAIGEESNGWFSFDVMAARPSISVVPGGVYAAWDGSLALDGLVRAEDIAAAADVERLVSASVKGQALSLSWSHEGQA